ncbi:MAG TPA: hypothetical protein VEG68_04845 [Terriglobales bacterium]|nr:hypothetical protein [Terriglobales bacterium]
MSHSKFLLLFFCLALFLFWATVPAYTEEEASLSAPSKMTFLSHHLQFLSADGCNQYRYMDNKPGDVTVRDDFYKVSTVGRLTLLGEGVTYLQFRAESGRVFNFSYDFAGIGMHPGYWSFNLKSLFVGQKIGHHLEAQAGGIEYDRGAGTEATYADNDGWLEGYRLAYTSHARWVPDVLSATVGYVGDFEQPNVFARLPHMGDENYIQALAHKYFGTNRDVSAEFDSLQSIRYTREAVHLQKLPLVVADELVAETITRASDDTTFGWSGTVFKTLDRKGRVRLGAFISDLPESIFLKGKNTILLNGDFYVLGQRMGPNVRIIPFKNFEVTLQGSVRTDNTPSTRYRGQVTVCYHFTGLLNRALR